MRCLNHWLAVQSIYSCAMEKTQRPMQWLASTKSRSVCIILNEFETAAGKQRCGYVGMERFDAGRDNFKMK